MSFHDYATLESIGRKELGGGQAALCQIAQMVGRPTGKPKPKQPEPDQIFLGLINNLQHMKETTLWMYKIWPWLGRHRFLSCAALYKAVRGGL
mgnify:CR=1 FL=1